MTVVIPLKGQSLLSKATFQKIKWKTIAIYWGKGSPKPGEAYLLAEEAGRGEKMKEAIFLAHFVEKKNIGDIKVLEEIGEKIGLGINFSKRLRSGDKAKDVQKALDMARAYGIDETPHLNHCWEHYDKSPCV